MYVIVGFHQRNQLGSQEPKNVIFFRLNVSDAQCKTGAEKNPDSVLKLNYDDEEYSQVIGQIKQVFRYLTKDDNFHLHIIDHDITSSNIGDGVNWIG